jgi:hypothetical protein
VLACYVEELKPLRKLTSGGAGASGCADAAGSALGTGDRKLHELVAGGMRKGAGFWFSEFGVWIFRKVAMSVGSERIYATSLRFL